MNERKLYDCKWFDYRLLDPDVATLALCNEYVYYQSVFNDRLGEEGKLPKVSNMFYSGFDWACLRNWKRFDHGERLRRWADERGLRYDLFWQWALGAYEKIGLGTKRMGRERVVPFSSFLNATILQMVEEKAEAVRAEQIIMSDHPYFQAGAYTGDRLQIAYQLYLLKEVRQRWPADYKSRLGVLVESGRFSMAWLGSMAA